MSESAATTGAAKPGIVPAGELFSGLFPEELEQVRALARRVEVPAGMTLFRFGEPATALLRIESGRLALTLPLTIRGVSRNVTVEEKGPGTVVGWSALVPPHQLTLGAHSLEPSVVESFDRAQLTAFLDRQPRLKLVFISNLAQVIAGRLCQLEGILLRDLQRFVTETCA